MKQKCENSSNISNLILEAILMSWQHQSRFCNAPKVFSLESILSTSGFDELKIVACSSMSQTWCFSVYSIDQYVRSTEDPGSRLVVLVRRVRVVRLIRLARLVRLVRLVNPTDLQQITRGYTICLMLSVSVATRDRVAGKQELSDM